MFAWPSKKSGGESQMSEIVNTETTRQWEKLILIASESICHPEAQKVLSTPLTNLYAEGQPEPPLMHDPRQASADVDRFHSWQTRFADNRFYRGCVEANRAELLAQWNIAQAFARLKDSPKAEDIHVVVQALSGAPANTAVYEALCQHGDHVLGLDLAHGGHLTHGSQYNYSGKTFKVKSYGIDPKTRVLDYNKIREMAREHKPKLIIGGASSYPWDFDWKELRSIADEVGAYLLADIAHYAGMIVAGHLRNPIPHAHVVTFTTHKSLCGPRGAVIITTYPEINQKLRNGVFPGLQGGPHIHTIAAIGRIFEIINAEYETYGQMQKQIIENAKYLAECLKNEGFALEYNGTEMHMVLVDLKKFNEHPNPKTIVDGEMASRLLEIANIVCNKNVLPGDASGGKASGIRLGMPWLTQRGITKPQIKELASIIKFVLSNIETFHVWVPAGEERCRGRVPFGLLEQAKARVLKIAEALPYPEKPKFETKKAAAPKVGDRVAYLLRGDKVRLALSQMLTCKIEGAAVAGEMLHSDGSVIDDVVAVDLGLNGREEQFALLVHEKKAAEVAQWITELSDGYLKFDPKDLYAKVDGPTVVEPLPQNLVAKLPKAMPKPSTDLTKIYFIGEKSKYAAAKLQPLKKYEYKPEELPLMKTVLNETHKQLGGKMVPFAGWEMPVQYTAGIFPEHNAVRTAAGLFDVSHMSLFEVSGPHALSFLDTVLANTVSRLDPGQAQYTYLLGPDGVAIDDMYVYRMGREKFMCVANAANAEKDWAWFSAVNSREYIIDNSMPAKMVDGKATLRNLRENDYLGIALQGPLSTKLLISMAKKAEDKFRLDRISQNEFAPVNVAGIDILAARTGYTGEKIGYELYVHPSKCVALWNAILEDGKKMGVIATGLAARDSTRTEAGFPLFGHELEGHCGLSLTDAGYGYVTRFHVPFFIGREPYMKRVAESNRQVIRMTGQGRRSIRPGHVLVDAAGKMIGEISSFAYTKADFTFHALGWVKKESLPAVGSKIRAVRETADKFQAVNESAVVDLTVLDRFPTQQERESWPVIYKM